MRLGKKIEQAIDEAGLKLEAVAGHVDVSVATIRRLLDKDSIDTDVLIKISALTNKPLSFFVEDLLIKAGATYSVSQTGSGNAGRDIRKQKNISGGVSTGNVGEFTSTVDLQAKLQVCEAEKAGLEKLLAAKEEIIEVLKGRG